jgi:hypothetical protein
MPKTGEIMTYLSWFSQWVQSRGFCDRKEEQLFRESVELLRTRFRATQGIW